MEDPLQCASPALPAVAGGLCEALTQLSTSVHRRVGQWDCDFYDKVGNLVSFGTANTETLGELVWAFFEYWAWKHDYNTAVVSVRTGGFLTKAQKEWTRRIGNERHLVSIEVRMLGGAWHRIHGTPM